MILKDQKVYITIIIILFGISIGIMKECVGQIVVADVHKSNEYTIIVIFALG